jgi:hypothetical protein
VTADCLCNRTFTENDNDGSLSVNDKLAAAISYIQSILCSEPQINVELLRILATVDEQHRSDVLHAEQQFATEQRHPRIPNQVTYEHCYNGDYLLSIRSTNTTVMDFTSRETIRTAAEQIWSNQQLTASTAASRFTYQQPGNYEAHVADMGHEAKQIMNDFLVQKIYPFLRHAFQYQVLCVYDALYIRYNATYAKEQGIHEGAGQPLHKDLGLFSVNVIINEPTTDFEGGGTFFENSLRCNGNGAPLKPFGAGHLLAHRSSERHAGAATTEGVRDILVVFIMSKDTKCLRSARLKQQTKTAGDTTTNSGLLRLCHQYLAVVESQYKDGEALQYLALAVQEYADTILASASDSHQECLSHARVLLERSVEANPCDARGWNNLGLLLGQLFAEYQACTLEDVIGAYNCAIQLLERTLAAGVNVQYDLFAARLNLGHFLANLDRFEDAVRELDPIVQMRGNAEGRVVEDAFTLWRYCSRRVGKPS